MRRQFRIGDYVLVTDLFRRRIVFRGILTEQFDIVCTVTDTTGKEFPCLPGELRHATELRVIHSTKRRETMG